MRSTTWETSEITFCGLCSLAVGTSAADEHARATPINARQSTQSSRTVAIVPGIEPRTLIHPTGRKHLLRCDGRQPPSTTPGLIVRLRQAAVAVSAAVRGGADAVRCVDLAFARHQAGPPRIRGMPDIRDGSCAGA